MNIKIYQINMDRDKDRVAFMALDTIEKFQHSAEIHSEIYDLVYESNVNCSILEDVFAVFNLNHPGDYHGRSLSVSDIVQVVDGGDISPGFYFCDSVGFKEVNFDPEQAHNNTKLSVLLVEPGKAPRMIDMEDTLEAMQRIVGGDIEEYMPFEDPVAIICNEEGKINGLPLNRAIRTEDERKEIIDIIAGSFFICHAPIDAERFQSLPEKFARKYAELFKNPERFFRTANGIVAVPYNPEKNFSERRDAR